MKREKIQLKSITVNKTSLNTEKKPGLIRYASARSQSPATSENPSFIENDYNTSCRSFKSNQSLERK